MYPSLTSILTLALVTTGCGHSFTQDPTEILARYPHRVRSGDCSSWLTSAQTGHPYCASPAFNVHVDPPLAAPGTAAPDPTQGLDPTDQAAMIAAGETLYGDNCAVCHQANGQGLAGSFPPLAGAGSYYGSAQNHARIIVHGLSGPIVVSGVSYNGAMPPQGNLSDLTIAAIATYERNAWGNSDGMVTPEDVAAVR